MTGVSPPHFFFFSRTVYLAVKATWDAASQATNRTLSFNYPQGTPGLASKGRLRCFQNTGQTNRNEKWRSLLYLYFK